MISRRSLISPSRRSLAGIVVNQLEVHRQKQIFLLLAGCGINGQIVSGANTPAQEDCTASNSKAALWPYSQCLDDSFSVTNPGGISPPTICGKNQGRHSKIMKIKKISRTILIIILLFSVC